MGSGSRSVKPFRFSLDFHSGVPVYRQIVDQVLLGIVSGSLETGEQLPTVRQLAVDLSINPNTVVRAYHDLEARGAIETHQGSGTFVGAPKLDRTEVQRQRHLDQLAGTFLARAAEAGFSFKEVLQCLRNFETDGESSRRKS